MEEFCRELKNSQLPEELVKALEGMCFTYAKAAKANGWETSHFEPILRQFLKLTTQEFIQPFQFEPFHQRMTAPFDYYHFGLDFIRPLAILNKSQVIHPENLEKIDAQLSRGDNVILLANHQTELDPQAISLLLEEKYPTLAGEMIFVAGHRVITDPMAISFSKGRNLLCIYSKKYIEDNPATKEDKLLHNKRTMNQMSQLLSEGGKCIYVAPSGGRDRPDSSGKLQVAPFDPQSIEMFWLMSQKAEHPTHFYPLALLTYDLLPPPDSVLKSLGEPRHTKAAPIYLAFGQEIDMEQFSDTEQLDKKQKRKLRAEFIWKQVCQDYKLIEALNPS